MLDELLGRAPLKDRIDALEETVDRLEAQLEAERERRATAVRDRQAADERVNRLGDRIADLEGQLDRARSGAPQLDFRGVERLRGGRLEAVLDRLERVRAPPDGALTAAVGEAIPEPVDDAFGDHVALIRRAMPCLVVVDDAGVVAAALDPPLRPDPFVEWDDRFRLDRSWFLPSGRFAVVLVRSDQFAYGEYDGRERTHFEGFESDVRSAHSKGGFSQGRFERRRDDQIDAHLERGLAVLDEHDPDRLVVVGERTRFGPFADRAVATVAVDASGDPESALDAAFHDLWTTTLYQI